MKVVTWSRESHGLFDYDRKILMLKNAKQIILAKFIEAVYLYFIFFTDESEVEIVDYYENQMIKD